MDYSNECSLVRDRAVVAAREEIRLFCRILGYSNNDLNHLIGDDPHGIVDMQEGYRYFNMTDIHVLIADYARWLAIYKDNQTLRKVVDEWYYWTLGNHDPRKDGWVSVKDRLPERTTSRDSNGAKIIDCCSKDVFGYDASYKIGRLVCYNHESKMWESHDAYIIGEITHWMPTTSPNAKHRYCNLKNWLMGWRPKPEDCLPYYNEHQAQEQAAAQKRVEQAKADLEQEVKQFNEGKY